MASRVFKTIKSRVPCRITDLSPGIAFLPVVYPQEYRPNTCGMSTGRLLCIVDRPVADQLKPTRTLCARALPFHEKTSGVVVFPAGKPQKSMPIKTIIEPFRIK